MRTRTEPSGYLHPDYARSLVHLGQPLELPRSGAWLLQRPVPGLPGGARDAVAPYPLLAARDWGGLPADLAALEGRLLTVTAVTDPLAPLEGPLLERAFPDLVRPFKEHWITDLRRPLEETVSEHHRRNVRRALREVRVEACADPPSAAGEWVELYGRLVRRHGIRGPAAFPAGALEAQLRVPGVELLRATLHGATVAMAVWYADREVAWYHLGAATEEGYAARASFAVFFVALSRFRDRGLERAALGAGSGLVAEPGGGLERFKRGWATGSRTAFLCGRVCDREGFEEARSRCGEARSDFFPPYRSG